MAVDNTWLMKYRSQAGEQQQDQEPPEYELMFQTRAKVSMIWPGGHRPPDAQPGMIRNIDRVEVLEANLGTDGFVISLLVLAWHDEAAQVMAGAEEAVDQAPAWAIPGAHASMLERDTEGRGYWRHYIIAEIRHLSTGWNANVGQTYSPNWLPLRSLKEGWLEQPR